MKTVTLTVPAVTMSEAGIEAVSRVALTKVVVRLEPPHFTTEPFTKLVPVTVRVKADPPAVVEEGLRPPIVGVGLLMVKGWAPEATPPGFNTVTLIVPATAISAAAIAAVNRVSLT